MQFDLDKENEAGLMPQIHLLDYWKTLRKHLNLALAVFSVILAGSLFYIFTAIPVYQAVSRIILTEDLSRSVMHSELVENVFNDQLRFETELQILRGDPIYEDVLSSLRLTSAPKNTREYSMALLSVKNSVDCSRLRNTRLLEIRAFSVSPDSAALLANTVVSVYINRYRARQLESSRNTASWLNEQLLDLEYKVKNSQQELLEYISTEQLTFVSDGTGLESELKSDLFKAPDEALLEDIHTRLIQAILARDEILQRYKGKHQKVLDAEANVVALQREYGLEKERLNRERQILTSKIIEARKKAVQYDILKRQVDTNKELYNLFTRKMQEVDLTQGFGEGDIKIVEAATVPLRPSKPRKSLMLMIGILLGSGCGILAAFLMEYMDRSLKTKEEIESLTGLAVLSSINMMELRAHSILDPKNYFADSAMRQEHELFRVLRANIKFADFKQKTKILLVTSGCPGEGKTTISVRLAINMAAAGERVLLIDGDLRKPNIHRICGLENTCGLTNLIVEETINRDNIHYDTAKGLDVITSGPIPAQPAELIENSRIKTLLTEFSSEYDRIIIDSPPVATVIDAALFAAMSDGVLLVIDPRTTDRHILKHAQAQIEKSGIRIIGLVLNKISTDGDSGYYYSYYHYSSYYGEDGQSKKKKRSRREKREQKEPVAL